VDLELFNGDSYNITKIFKLNVRKNRSNRVVLNM
jgi:hypothetical protein